MQKFNLSKRMSAVADLVPRGVSVCDIGCDHGFVAIYLVQKRICPKVIAMDINRGPLSRAREHIESTGLSSYIETRLSDGMEKLNTEEAECIIAAGMGGRLIVKILEDYPEKRNSLRYMVLQPQSEPGSVRKYLRENGLMIRKEDMVLEDGKFYPMMLAEGKASGAESTIYDSTEKMGDKMRFSGRKQKDSGMEAAYLESLEDEFGPCLIGDKHPVLAQYLDWWERQQNRILKEVSAYPERRTQVEEEIRRIRDVRGLVCGGSAYAEPENSIGTDKVCTGSTYAELE
jgi:tRNA (adenine22-N1)-methyltransferase